MTPISFNSCGAIRHWNRQWPSDRRFVADSAEFDEKCVQSGSMENYHNPRQTDNVTVIEVLVGESHFFPHSASWLKRKKKKNGACPALVLSGPKRYTFY